MQTQSRNIRLSAVVGGHYDDFWRFRGRYRVCKGSRGSKKSKTAALWFIYHLMRYPEANLLVVRKVFRTLKDSCFTELKWAIERLGVAAYWDAKESPLEMTYKPTGQKIYFRGLDDPMKVTSITVARGALCWLWVEEAYELLSERDFDFLDESIRGAVPDGLFKQATLTFNPWNERHWLKRRFFDAPHSADVLAMTTTYEMNEWLQDDDRAMFERMRERNPARFRVAGLGEWGVVDGAVYENWREAREGEIDAAAYGKQPGIFAVFGLDFGYVNDPSALLCAFVDARNKRLYVFDELYEKALTNEALYKRIAKMGYAKERIAADSADPKSIDHLRELGLARIRAARKGRDSVISGIDFIRDFEIVVHPSCCNFITEISNYMWREDKTGKRLNVPAEECNHLMDAMRYAMEDLARGKSFSFE